MRSQDKRVEKPDGKSSLCIVVLYYKTNTDSHCKVVHPVRINIYTLLMPYKVSKAYPKSTFRRILKANTALRVANDNTDMLVYLLYMEYLSKLMASSEGDILEGAIEAAHQELLRKYRG